jgi:hypothetical protein
VLLRTPLALSILRRGDAAPAVVPAMIRGRVRRTLPTARGCGSRRRATAVAVSGGSAEPKRTTTPDLPTGPKVVRCAGRVISSVVMAGTGRTWAPTRATADCSFRLVKPFDLDKTPFDVLNARLTKTNAAPGEASQALSAARGETISRRDVETGLVRCTRPR